MSNGIQLVNSIDGYKVNMKYIENTWRVAYAGSLGNQFYLTFTLLINWIYVFLLSEKIFEFFFIPNVNPK